MKPLEISSFECELKRGNDSGMAIYIRFSRRDGASA
jgi:hypothetical protein